MSLVESEYRLRMAAMTPAEKMERSANLLAWARELTGRKILSEIGEMSPARLKWEIALRHYGHQPEMRRLIEQAMTDVPH